MTSLGWTLPSRLLVANSDNLPRSMTARKRSLLEPGSPDEETLLYNLDSTGKQITHPAPLYQELKVCATYAQAI